jgi:hypothetical protein
MRGDSAPDDEQDDAAESTPDADPSTGSSGAEEGISPLSPEQYETDPEGPTTSTED